MVRSPVDALVGWRWFPVLWVLGLWFLYVLTANTSAPTIDSTANHLNAQAVALQGTPWLDTADVRPPDGWPVPFAETTPSGHTVSVRTPGQIWWAVPFFALMGSGAGHEVSPLPGGIAAATATALAMGVLLAGLRRLVPPRVALWTAAVVALATPVWSVAADFLLTHPVTVLGLSTVVWGHVASRPWVVGLGHAAAILARPHLLVVAVLDLVARLLRREWRAALAVAAPVGVALAALLGWNRLLWERWTLSTYGRDYGSLVPGTTGGGQGHDLMALAGSLVSPSRGLFWWTPVLLVALALLAGGVWRRVPSWALVLAVGGGVYAVVQAAASLWSGGSGFYGYRHGLEPLILLVPVLAVTVGHAGVRARVLLALLGGLQLAAIALGAPGPGATHDPTQELGRESMSAWGPNATWWMLQERPSLWVVFLLVALAGTVAGWGLLRRREPPRALA